MNIEKLKPLSKGIIKFIPGVKGLINKHTGGTDNSRYCYSVWFRHLKIMFEFSNNLPLVVAELGPGDSLGVGFCALLSGCEKVIYLDVVKFWNVKRNLQIFDELVELFKQRSMIPDNKEFPKVKPELTDYFFPNRFLSDDLLNQSLDLNRLNKIRNEIKDIDNPNNIYIKYSIPWYDSKVIETNSIDFILSQAVLEHVEDLSNTYKSMSLWLKPGGFMSHDIDFKSHGITKSWNGHWLFSDWEWKIVQGGEDCLINREPVSKHKELLDQFKFDIIIEKNNFRQSEIDKSHLSHSFIGLTMNDLTTPEAYILSKKRSSS